MSKPWGEAMSDGYLPRHRRAIDTARDKDLARRLASLSSTDLDSFNAEAIASGDDVYVLVTAHVLNCYIDDVLPTQRAAVKQILIGLDDRNYVTV